MKEEVKIEIGISEIFFQAVALKELLCGLSESIYEESLNDIYEKAGSLDRIPKICMDWMEKNYELTSVMLNSAIGQLDVIVKWLDAFQLQCARMAIDIEKEN